MFPTFQSQSPTFGGSESFCRHSLCWLQQELRGETQRKFITRKSKHQKAVARRQGGKSALADHVIKTNHDIAWDEATILRTNNNWHQRKILEAWEINCAKDPLNRDDGALLHKEYLHLTLANKKKWYISWILISVLFISVLLHKFFFHFPWWRSVIVTETLGTFLL